MIRSSTVPWARRLRKNRCQWPSPELSTGLFYRKMGSSSCWEAVGTARETFIRIAEDIRVYLDKYSDEVPHQVTWTMYMIGKTKESAEPMIMFCCRDTDCRKQVRKTVEQSRILERYPGVRVGDAVRPPDFDQLVQLAGNSSHKLGDITSFGGKRSRSRRVKDDDLVTKPTSNATIYGQKDRLGTGCPIFISSNQQHNTSSSIYVRATAGGILVAGNRFFYLTAGHAFDSPPDMLPKTEDGEDQDDYEFDIDEDDDSDGDSGFVETTSRGSLSPDLADYNGSDDSGPSSELSDHSILTACKEEEIDDRKLQINRIGSMSLEDDPEKTAIHLLETKRDTSTPVLPLSMDDHVIIGDLLEATGHQPHLDLDYALVECRPGLQDINSIEWISGHFRRLVAPRSVVMEGPREASILAVTGSAGVLEGILSGTPTYRNQPGSAKFQELWTVRLLGELSAGDCGSWIVDATTGDLFGHIIAGSPKSGVAYILPARQIFHDAMNRYGLNLELSSRSPTSTGSVEHNGKITLDSARAMGTSESAVASKSLFLSDQGISAKSKGKQREQREQRESSSIDTTLATGSRPWEYARSTAIGDRGKVQRQSRKVNLMMSPDHLETDSDNHSDSRHETRGLFSISENPLSLLTPPDDPFRSESEPLEYTPQPPNIQMVPLFPRTVGRSENARSVSSDDSGISGMSSSNSARISTYDYGSDHARPLMPKGGSEGISMSRASSSYSMSRASSSHTRTRIESKDISQDRSISKPSYQRPKHDRVYCKLCDNHPEGFRGEHEYRRHVDREHKSIIKKWVCVEPTNKGHHSQPVIPLSRCKACSQQKKKYGAYYNAAAHLRRAHFNPKTKGRDKNRQKVNEADNGGKASGDDPPMAELKKYWMKEVEERADFPTDDQQQVADESEDGSQDGTLGVASNNFGLFDSGPAAQTLSGLSWFNDTPLAEPIFTVVPSEQFSNYHSEISTLESEYRAKINTHPVGALSSTVASESMDYEMDSSLSHFTKGH